MDTAELKRELEVDLTFWGGGVVFTAVHNIQADAPAENVSAMWDAP